jgi:hypothetical protein
MSNEIIEPLTYKEQNRDFSLKVLKAMRHLAITMNEVYRDFWSRDPQQIVDSLNADLQLSLSRFDSNTLIGNMVNDRMAAAGQNERVAVTMPEGFSFNATSGVFVYTHPIIAPPEPDIIEPPMPDLSEPTPE